MGDPILQLTNPAHWEMVYESSFQASLVNPRSWYPLEPIIVPVLLSSQYLALAASSVDAQPNWQFGYWARQYIAPTGLGFGAIESRSYKAFLSRTSLAYFERLAPEYQLRLEFPYWFKSMDVAIWEYKGPTDDSTEVLIRDQIDSLKINLLRLETKIDSL